MSPRSRFAAAALAMLAAHAAGQTHQFTIWAEAPETVLAGETFTVEFWGAVDSPVFVQGESTMAGFHIDAIGSGSVESVGYADIEPWAEQFAGGGTIEGASLVGVTGGWGYSVIAPPLIFNFDNPIRLFTFEVTAGESGSITYTPGHPHPAGGLAFYPIYTNGASITAPNDPNTSLALIGATTRIVPAPTSIMLVGTGLLSLGSRRRNT